MKLKRNESILISMVALSLLFAYQHFWKKPKIQELAAMKEKSTTLMIEIGKNQMSLAKLNQRGPASVSLEKYLKPNDRFSNVVTGIINGSKNNAFNLSRISTEGQSKVHGYIQTLYNLEAEASFIAIGKFLESLEDSSLLTEVESIDIHRVPNEMKRCKVKIKLYSYVRGDAV